MGEVAMDGGGGSGRVVEADALVVGRVLRGEAAAYGELVARYERAVLGVVMAVVRDGELAREVVQAVFVRGFEKLDRLRDGGRFAGWVMRMARREAMREGKRRRRMVAVVERGADGGVAEVEVEEERLAVLAAVGRLPEQERVVVGLRYFEGMAVAEVAAVTGRPVGTVTKQLSRAVERLRGMLEEGG